MSQDLDERLLPDTTRVGAADAAEAVLDRAEGVRRPDRFLGAVLDGMGAEGLLERHPARIFDALVLGRDDAEAARLHDLFEVVALPGQAPTGRLRAGDVLIRRTDGGRGHAAILTAGELQAPDSLESLGLFGEAAPGGHYARVAEPGPRTRTQARRALDGAGRAPFDQVILRVRGGGGATESLAEGDTNNREYVRWIQTALNQATGSALAVDGLYGPQTRSAVRAFQQSKGLTVDGIVGPRTDAALRAAAGGAGGEALKLPTRCIGLPERQVIDNFEFGKADVLPRHQPQIVGAAFCIRDSQRSRTPITTLTDIGHTDPVGDAAANEALGRRRAEAVGDQIKEALRRITGQPPRLTVTVETRGEREPVPGDPGMSRRVEVVAPFAFPIAKPVPPKPPPRPPVPPSPASVLDPPRWRAIISPRLSGNVALRSGNNVRHLIDAENAANPALATYRAMVDDINAARGEGSFIYLLGWAMVDNFEMIPCSPNTTARALLAAAAGRGVQIRAMLWRQPPIVRAPTETSAQNINDLHARAGFDAAAIVDNETLSPSSPPFGSHHQKVLVIKGENGLVGYVGGLDLNSDRIRRCPTAPPAPGGGGGSGPSGSGTDDPPPAVASSPASAPLHDVHCRIDGPSAADLLTTFIRRWDHHPGHVAIDARRALIGRGVGVPAAKTSSPVSQSSTGATCSVVIGRTFNPVTPGTSVPRERDIRTLLLAAIGAAQRFIYMEDQYLISLDAARALNAAVPRLQHLTILIGASEVISDTPCIWTFRRDFFTALTRGLSPSDLDKVRIFRLASGRNPTPLPACGAATPGFTPTFGAHTYVHTKSWFFDDELAVIGTANCNRRGWEHDSEVDAFIFDDARPTGSALTFCQKARMDLWAEHLNAPASRFTDGVASAGAWLAPPAGHRVLRYCPNGGSDTLPVPEALCGERVRSQVDPPGP